MGCKHLALQFYGVRGEPQCTQHIVGREVSRLTRGMAVRDTTTRKNNFVEGNKDKGATKGEKDLSLCAPHGEPEVN